jgi:(1->4)-alpha-D-glucan 1-alpha-D-glucosylmutase
MTPEQVCARADDGLPKLWVTTRALQLRRERPHAFGESATYEAMQAQGSKAQHAVAFLRSGEVASIAPRLVMGLNDDWAETSLTLPDGIWRNVLTGDDVKGGAVRLAELTARFPVALLARE